MNFRKTLFVAGLLLTVFLISCNTNSRGKLPADLVTNPNSAEGRNNEGLPVIQFDKDVHDFGKLIAGEKASFGFRFTNAGSADLLISQVNTTCGCTIPKFPKTPIKPGEKKEITVTFDSEGKKGIQNKSITVVTNCQPPQTVIWIKAMVIAN